MKMQIHGMVAVVWEVICYFLKMKISLIRYDNMPNLWYEMPKWTLVAVNLWEHAILWQKGFFWFDIIFFDNDIVRISPQKMVWICWKFLVYIMQSSIMSISRPWLPKKQSIRR